MREGGQTSFLQCAAATKLWESGLLELLAVKAPRVRARLRLDVNNNNNNNNNRPN